MSASSSSAAPRRAIVTGGATNIGRAITEALLARGYRVVVGARRTETAASLVAAHGNRVIPLSVDIGDPAQCQSFIAAAVERLGGLDVLVNNAAVTGPNAVARFADITPEHFRRVVDVNLGGVVFCSQAAVPHLRAAGGGVIVHISSINAFRPQQGAVTQSMARELAPDRIRVVAIAPGDIANDDDPGYHAAIVAKGAGGDIVNQTPLGRGRTRDIGATVAFVCSPDAAFVTGTTWLVDGGLLA